MIMPTSSSLVVVGLLLGQLGIAFAGGKGFMSRPVGGMNLQVVGASAATTLSKSASRGLQMSRLESMAGRSQSMTRAGNLDDGVGALKKVNSGLGQLSMGQGRPQAQGQIQGQTEALLQSKGTAPTNLRHLQTETSTQTSVPYTSVSDQSSSLRSILVKTEPKDLSVMVKDLPKSSRQQLRAAVGGSRNWPLAVGAAGLGVGVAGILIGAYESKKANLAEKDAWKSYNKALGDGGELINGGDTWAR